MVQVTTTSGNNGVRIRVKKLFRPHQVKISAGRCFAKDMNLVYWSDIEMDRDATEVAGKCFVRPASSIKVPIQEWTSMGAHRFYYEEAYDKDTRSVVPDLPRSAEKYGAVDAKDKGHKGKGKGKGTCKPTTTKTYSSSAGVKSKLHFRRKLHFRLIALKR